MKLNCIEIVYQYRNGGVVIEIKQIMQNGWVKLLVTILVLIVIATYCALFFRKGIYFEGAFLKKYDLEQVTRYVGEHERGQIFIEIPKASSLADISVDFNLPNNIDRRYKLSLVENDRNIDIHSITLDGNKIFEGSYRKNDSYLLDEHGNPVLSIDWSTLNLGYSRRVQFTEDYNPPLMTLVRLVTGDYDRRGDVERLILGLIIGVAVIIDIKYPTLLFTLQHRITVSNPEPSDFYITMQIISWIIMPIISLYLLITAL